MGVGVVRATVGVGGTGVAIGAGTGVGTDVAVDSGELQAMAANVMAAAMTAMIADCSDSARLLSCVGTFILILRFGLC